MPHLCSRSMSEQRDDVRTEYSTSCRHFRYTYIPELQQSRFSTSLALIGLKHPFGPPISKVQRDDATWTVFRPHKNPPQFQKIVSLFHPP